jgi:Arc/MetJ-type ribon-helix-helix transcriptional regulator
MAKVAVNIPDEEKNLMDRFVEKIPGYQNRSDFIRKALRKEMRRDYLALEEVTGDWSEEEAEEAEKKIEELDREDIRSQQE